MSEPVSPPPGYGNLNPPPKANSGEQASSILTEAANIVKGDRNTTHGEKERSFAAIATLWNAFLTIRKEPNAPISAADVSAMMTLMKFVRAEQGAFIRDHAVDAAGYAAIYGELRSLEV